eukprot:403344265
MIHSGDSSLRNLDLTSSLLQKSESSDKQSSEFSQDQFSSSSLTISQQLDYMKYKLNRKYYISSISSVDLVSLENIQRFQQYKDILASSQVQNYDLDESEIIEISTRLRLQKETQLQTVLSNENNKRYLQDLEYVDQVYSQLFNQSLSDPDNTSMIQKNEVKIDELQNIANQNTEKLIQSLKDQQSKVSDKQDEEIVDKFIKQLNKGILDTSNQFKKNMLPSDHAQSFELNFEAKQLQKNVEIMKMEQIFKKPSGGNQENFDILDSDLILSYGNIHPMLLKNPLSQNDQESDKQLDKYRSFLHRQLNHINSFLHENPDAISYLQSQPQNPFAQINTSFQNLNSSSSILNEQHQSQSDLELAIVALLLRYELLRKRRYYNEFINTQNVKPTKIIKDLAIRVIREHKRMEKRFQK